VGRCLVRFLRALGVPLLSPVSAIAGQDARSQRRHSSHAGARFGRQQRHEPAATSIRPDPGERNGGRSLAHRPHPSDRSVGSWVRVLGSGCRVVGLGLLREAGRSSAREASTLLDLPGARRYFAAQIMRLLPFLGLLVIAGCGNDFDPDKPVRSRADALKAARYAYDSADRQGVDMRRSPCIFFNGGSWIVVVDVTGRRPFREIRRACGGGPVAHAVVLNRDGVVRVAR